MDASSALYTRVADLVNGLHSFPTSATSADGVPDTLVPGLQFGVTGISTTHYLSHLFSVLVYMM